MFSLKHFLANWLLAVAIVTGILMYLAMHFIPALAVNVEPWFSPFAKNIQPVLVALMLFLQFNKVSPKDLRLRKWHLFMLGFQALAFLVFAGLAIVTPDGLVRLLSECAMLCFICPTAAAAGVITDKLGGSLSDTVAYVVLINVLAAVLIPLVIPVVHPSAHASFVQGFLGICGRVFPMLVLPLLLAWFIRFALPKLHDFLMRFVSWAYYVWGIALTLSIFLSTRALVHSGISVMGFLSIGVLSLACCLLQFSTGRVLGRKASGELLSRSTPAEEPDLKAESITAGQALGQKNSGFLIWLGYSYMTPVTSVAGGLYSIWHNLVNSWELHEKRHENDRKG